MDLTWKDFFATGLALGVGLFAYLMVQGYQFPFITGYRGATLVLLGLGIMMCGLSPAASYSNPWIITVSILGGLTLFLIIASLIMGTKTLFLATAGAILTMWAVATFRHLIGA